MQEPILASATFDAKVKVYWLVLYVLISTATIMFIPLIPIVVILVLFIGHRVLKAMSAELYERKLVVKRGVLTKVEKSIPLEKITDVGMVQGPLMRVFGLYRLDFETAGQSGVGALVSMLGIEHAAEFRETILSQKDKLQDKVSSNNQSSENDGTDMEKLVASVQRIEALLQKLSETKTS